MIEALHHSLARLELLADDAIASMTSATTIDDRAMADAKGRALLELSRMRAPSPEAMPQDMIALIERVRAKLSEEGRLLKLRLEAAELVSGIVADAVMTAEWDGTYDERLPHKTVERRP